MALLLVMICIAVAVTLGLTFLGKQSVFMGIARNNLDYAAARCIAESAMFTTIRHLDADDAWRTRLKPGLWGDSDDCLGGTYELHGDDGQDLDGDGVIEGDGDLADDPSDPVTLHVTARYGDAVYRATVVYSRTSSGNGFPEHIATNGTVALAGNSYIDSYDSTMGRYDWLGNKGSQAIVQVNDASDGAVSMTGGAKIKGHGMSPPDSDPQKVFAPSASVTQGVDTMEQTIAMPAISMPALPGGAGDVLYKDKGTHTLSGDLRVDSLEVTSKTTLKISGDVTIVVDRGFAMSGSSKIEVDAGSTFKLYVGEDFEISGGSSVLTDDGHSAARIEIHLLGAAEAKVVGNAELVGRIFAPQRTLQINGGGQVFGTFAGAALDMSGTADFHVDTNTAFANSHGGTGGGASASTVQWVNRR